MGACLPAPPKICAQFILPASGLPVRIVDLVSRFAAFCFRISCTTAGTFSSFVTQPSPEIVRGFCLHCITVVEGWMTSLSLALPLFSRRDIA